MCCNLVTAVLYNKRMIIEQENIQNYNQNPTPNYKAKLGVRLGVRFAIA